MCWKKPDVPIRSELFAHYVLRVLFVVAHKLNTFLSSNSFTKLQGGVLKHAGESLAYFAYCNMYPFRPRPIMVIF
jgi:hypothetical protein